MPFFVGRIKVFNDKMPEKGLHTEGSLFEKKRDFDGNERGGSLKKGSKATFWKF